MNMDQEVPSYKVVLLGETAVGKSCLISRFINNTFLSNFVPTMGSCFSTKELCFEEFNKKRIKLEVWDTAGQEKYRSIAKMFYKEASVAILVYDITREESFLELKNFWYKEVRDNAENNIIIAIVGNKKDLYEYEEVNMKEIALFAKNEGAIFKETSAKEGNGVEELFRLIGLKLISPEYYDRMMNDSRFSRYGSKTSIQIAYSNKDTNINNSQFVSGGMRESIVSEEPPKKCC